MNIQVITDSTVDITEGTANELGIRVVPIYLRFGDKVDRDGVDITKDEFYAMLSTSPYNVTSENYEAFPIDVFRY